MDLFSQAILWLSLVVLAYAYVGFPLLVILVGCFRNRQVRKGLYTQRVTLIIAAYNEQDTIAARLENALSLEYPPRMLEIIVASDGSKDQTPSIVEEYAGRGVRLLQLPRRGKLHALNAAVRCASGDVLIFSDANSMFEPAALRQLIANFADPAVGGVAGCTRYTLDVRSESAARGENLYWKYDSWLKSKESRTGSVVSAHGGIYAIRRRLYDFIEDAAVTDDFTISTGVVERGFRLVYEPAARSYEIAVTESRREFHRRVRLMTRGFRALLLRRRLLNPLRYGFYSIVLFSHKVLRRIAGLFLPAILVANAHLVNVSLFHKAGLAVQVGFYTLAGLGWLLRTHRMGQKKFFYVPFFYCMANLAAVKAFGAALCGSRIEFWQPQRHAAEKT